MKGLSIPQVLLLPLLFLLINTASVNSTSIKSLRPTESLDVNKTLVSPNGKFLLSFYTLPRSPNHYYLALKYAGVPDMLWIANRDKPIDDPSSATLTLSADGTLVLDTHELFKPKTNLTDNAPTLHLLNTGNLVLTERTHNRDSTLWESFHYPTDSMLPNMTIALDLRTNRTRSLSSWRNSDDPAVGNVTYSLSRGPHGSHEMYLSNTNGSIYYRPGPSNAIGLTRHFVESFKETEEEVSYSYSAKRNGAPLSRLVVRSEPEVALVHEEWDAEGKRWKELWKGPSEKCDFYDRCGSNGFCGNGQCHCLPEFETAKGAKKDCRRKESLPCGDNTAGFLELRGVRLPDTAKAKVEPTVGRKACADACSESCNCTAYAALYETEGCIMWFDALVDTEITSREDLHVLFLKSSTPGNVSTTHSPEQKSGKISKGTYIAVLAAIGGFVLAVLIDFVYLFTRKRTPVKRLEGIATMRRRRQRERAKLAPFGVTYEEQQHTFKIVLLGDLGVGKSSVLSCFIRNEFNRETESTICVDFATRFLTIDDEVVKAQIWDMVGMERNRAIAGAYYRSAVGAVLVYDVTNRSTFEDITGWLKELREHAKENVAVMLIGNKSDLRHLDNAVSTEEGKAFAEREGLSFMETSAMEGKIVEDAFVQLLVQIYDIATGTNVPSERTTDKSADLETGGNSVKANPS